MYVFVERRGGSLGHVLHISHVRCVSVLILLLSMTVVWELLKGDRSGWRARPGHTEGNMLGPQPEGSAPKVEGTFTVGVIVTAE